MSLLRGVPGSLSGLTPSVPASRSLSGCETHEIMATSGSPMAKELTPVDVTDTPGLLRLAEEVRRGGQLPKDTLAWLLSNR